MFPLCSLLDAEDIDSARPDEKSILTYVASYYHTFARMKNEQKSGKRIANVSTHLEFQINSAGMTVRVGGSVSLVQFDTQLHGWLKLKPKLALAQRNEPSSDLCS